MTRLAMKHNAVNLSQGFPDFAAPEEIKEARARPSPTTSINTPSPGAPSPAGCRRRKIRPHPARHLRSEREITICCGSTEAMMSAMMAIINPGDEIVVFEPFYENYGPDAILSGATPRSSKCARPNRKTKIPRGPSTKGNSPPLSARTPRPSSSTHPTIPPGSFH